MAARTRNGLILVLIALALGIAGYRWWDRTRVITTANGVGVNGVTLTSASMALPQDRVSFGSDAGGALLVQNCTACHSPEMILAQPKMPADKWQAEIDKMRKAYKAPVDAKDDHAIVAALLALPPQRVGTGSAPE